DLIEQIVQAIRRIGAQPRHIIELPAHRAQQLHLGHLAEALLPGRAVLRRDDDAHIGHDARIEHVLAEPYAITGDHVAALESCDSRDHRGTRYVELTRETGDAFASVGL